MSDLVPNPRRRRRIVLQARTSSARLPGKVLLTICDLPIAVLAAVRAGRDGTDTLIATSDHPSDDGLFHTLVNHGIRCLRGPLDDVLSRFNLATADLEDDDICVRLTCDNIFPDSDFVQRLIVAVEESGAGYSGFSGGIEGLPYGLSGEAMRVGLLRQAHSSTTVERDREHVTPWILRNVEPSAPFIPRVGGLDLSRLRCTIDTMDDYRNIAGALGRLDDPVNATWQELCTLLARWHSRSE
jgi:spore coat polysaccharide biosynthesis protein SpsF (cytidylyltransferase family)